MLKFINVYKILESTVEIKLMIKFYLVEQFL